AVTQAYISQSDKDAPAWKLDHSHRTGDGRVRFLNATSRSARGEPTTYFVCGDDLCIDFDLEANQSVRNIALAVVIQAPSGHRLITSWTAESGFDVDLDKGRHSFRCLFREVGLRPGQTVLVHLWAAEGETMDYVQGALALEVIGRDRFNWASSSPDQGA